MTTEEPRAFFGEKFRLYHTGDQDPYEWQKDLFDRLVAGQVPAMIDLPTGTGKTTFLLIWYLAMTWMWQRGVTYELPRRLFWVVNRRVVVDQATDEAEKIRCFSIEQDLMPVAVSTLRGQFADNGDWKLDPSRAAIVIGTVDMIGSKLLFMGYGDGPYWRAQHAGLLGVDALFVNDEAQLTPAFAKLLRAVEAMKPARKFSGRPGMHFRFCELSATPIGDKAARFPSEPEMDQYMEVDAAFRQTCHAEKRLYLYRESDRKKAETRFNELALAATAPRTVVFREKPEDARLLVEKLDAEYPGRAVLLTGTMRGLERDELVNDGIFKSFLVKEEPAEPVWLVATSAAEVGVNLTAERQVTMLVEADHLVQRFGRLNRFGGPEGTAHIVCAPVSDKEPVKAASLSWLETLPALGDGRDIRAATLREHCAPPEACTPLPRFAELDRWLIELWSQTTGKQRQYPKVSDWLHGKQDDIGQTSVAWRVEVDDLVRAHKEGWIDDDDLENAFKFFPVLAHETLTEPESRVKKKIEILAQERPETNAILLKPDGSAMVERLKDLSKRDLDEATIVLPPIAGRLIRGMFKETFESEGFDERRKDVADIKGDRRHFVANEKQEYPNEKLQPVALFDTRDEEAEKRFLIYCKTKPAKSAEGQKEYLLETHLAEVEVKAGQLAAALVPELETQYRLAGRNHDEGKYRDVWQRAMGRCAGKIVAKPFKPGSPQQLAGYRHELGTLANVEVADHLTTHLIASHHGHARPFFHNRAHDLEHLEQSQVAIDAAPQRFARLTEEWGPWGLAYLEAVFKAADGYVSGLAEGKYKAEEQIENE